MITIEYMIRLKVRVIDSQFTDIPPVCLSPGHCSSAQGPWSNPIWCPQLCLLL